MTTRMLHDRVRHGPMVLLVAVAFLAAIVLDATGHASTTGTGRPPAPVAASIPPADAHSSAWYCAAGTAAVGGNADETVFVTNVGTRPVRADVRVTADANSSTSRDVDIPARTRVAVRVFDVVATMTPGVVVESIGGPVVVEHEIRNGVHQALGPCAREAAATWYLPAGTTVKGAQQWLSLFDPFADDAIVDVTFLTDGGPQAPQALQGLVVPRHTKVVVPVHDSVQRQAVVATQVRARIGRVVAEQSLVFDPTSGRAGLTLALGAPTPAQDWSLPAGQVVAGPDAAVIANPGNTAATVTVDVVLDGEAKLTPDSVQVPDHSVVVVDLMARVPPSTNFWVRLHSDQPVVVAQTMNNALASATVPATPVVARVWAFASARSTPTATDVVVVANPSGRPVTVRFDALASGAASPVADAAVSIPAGGRVLVDMNARKVSPDAGLLVSADAPVVVERYDLTAQTMSAATGIPSVG